MRTLAVVMAEGLRGRPHPLTRDRATPAVPFGGVADHLFRRFQTSKGIGD
jgi:ADP-glucose pyrophosphorylase